MSGTTELPYRYRFSGVVSTDKTVLQNLETMCSAAGSFLTFDVNTGRWAVVINQATDSVASFDDSNILGGISINSTALNELYNSVKVSFPHQDLEDQRDSVYFEIPDEDRNANEPDNTLNIDYDIFSDPVVANQLAILELKQNRVDQIIRFTTDFSMIGLKAGDVIDVTNEVYGLDAQKYRIISIQDQDDDSGNITLDITALQYDEDVYNLDDLYRYARSNLNGLTTIGNIAAPATPSLTLYNSDSRPRVMANVVVPGYSPVESVELWYSTNNSTFINVGTEYAPGGGTFTTGSTVTFDFDQAATGNVYVKSRALNSVTTGPFSSVASAPYTRQQVTDAIKDGTTNLLGSSGAVLATALGIGTLVQKVGNAFAANANQTLADATFTQAGFPSVKSVPIFSTFQTTISTANVTSAFNTYIGSTPVAFNSSGYAGGTDGAVLNFTLGATVQQLMIVIQCPSVNASYEYYDNGTNSVETRSGFFAYMPCLYEVWRSGTKIQTNTADWQTQSVITLIANATPASYQIKCKPLQTYDMNQTTDNQIWLYSPTVFAQASGGGITATAFGFSVIP